MAVGYSVGWVHGTIVVPGQGAGQLACGPLSAAYNQPRFRNCRCSTTEVTAMMAKASG